MHIFWFKSFHRRRDFTPHVPIINQFQFTNLHKLYNSGNELYNLCVYIIYSLM